MCEGSLDSRPPLSEEKISTELERLAEILGGRELRHTASRRAIYETMLRRNDHTCVEHILDGIAVWHPALRVNKTTVYRTLELLEELGLVAEMRHADGRTQYELTMHGPHGHLICQRCGRVQDIAPAELERIQGHLAHAHGFRVQLLDQALAGVCDACLHA